MAREKQSGNERTPERVQNAAKAMNISSGMQRGYVPQNTGTYNQSGYTGNHQSVPYSRMSYNPSSMNGGQRGYSMPSDASNGNRKKKNSRRTMALIAILTLVILLVAGAVTYAIVEIPKIQKTEMMRNALDKYVSDDPQTGLFYDGVYVDGIHLGGMTPEQAMNTVQSQIRQRNDAWQVQLVYNGQVIATINASMLGMNTDPASVLNNAWLQGRQYNDLEQRYNEMLRLQNEHYEAYTAQPSGDTSVIDSLLAQIKAAIDRPAKDAEFVSFDTTQPYPFLFQEEQTGLELNTEPLISRLYQMVSTMESGTVEIIPDQIQPAVKKTDLQKHYMLRASVTTPIDSHSPENRNNNIRLAFSKINGYILQPGSTFKFNRIVGERTVANGFYTAIEYVYGEHVEGVGGGVCQASTTVYQAAVCAGLKVKGSGTKRYHHSDSVSYTDYGKDATVSDTKGHEKDLWFINNTDGPLYFVAEVIPDPGNKNRLICKVSIYGEDMGDVWYELISEMTDVLPAPYEPEYIRDKKGEYVTYTDQEKSVSKAQDGYIYKSYRVKYEANVQTGREELFTDRYEPKAEKIYVGVTKRE